MNIHGTTVLVLGGGGMVGRAVCRELIKRNPARIIVCSLVEDESRQAIASLQEEYERTRSLRPEDVEPIEFLPEWGNLFVREELRLKSSAEIMASPEGRAMVIDDVLSPLTLEVAESNFLYQLVLRYRPGVIVDAINTATGIAYSDLFSQARKLWSKLKKGETPENAHIEQLLASLYIPSLIRHVDVLYRAMATADTKSYVKLGTSGTGGMGWNIPYTHGEERPSSVLLSKSAVAGAHTMLLFLLARTPGIATFEEDENQQMVVKPPPSTMEIKPTAMIGWRGIGYGDIMKRGKPVLLEEVSLDQAEPLGATLLLEEPGRTQLSDRKLRTVFVDTGENGMFSTEEFVAITSPGQMEFVTPEEIARNVVDEVRGVNTGKDVINALNVTCMGPTYRAGFQRQRAIEKLRELEKLHGCDSVAFENLGPPRLSKLLFECYLLRRTYGTMQKVAKAIPAEMAAKVLELLGSDPDLLATPVSLGVPILLEQDGEPRLLRGRHLKTPPPQGQVEVEIEPHSVENWARAGWIDLRPASMQRWKMRMLAMIVDSQSIPAQDTSSRYVRDRDFWGGDWPIQPGEIVAWIFINEDKGERGRE